MFVVAMLIEFAIIILLTRKKQATDHDSSEKKGSVMQKGNAISLQLLENKIVPVAQMSQIEIQPTDNNQNGNNANQWMAKVKNYISGISLAQAIDFISSCLFVIMFTWFNIYHLQPLLDW